MACEQRGRYYSMRCSQRFYQTTCFAVVVVLLFVWLTVQPEQMLPRKTVRRNNVKNILMARKNNMDKLIHVYSKNGIVPVKIINDEAAVKIKSRSELPFQFKWKRHFNRNLSSYINPEKSTTLFEPENIICPLDYMFIIPSSVNNTHQREIIRRTWGSWINFAKGKVNSGKRLLFMLGIISTTNGNSTNIIYEEAIKHQDIIIENFVDSYLNLTLKSVFILKWVKLRCPNIKYLVKADDDMFINVPNLVKSMSAMKLPKKCMVGKLICNAKPIHNKQSKWFSPNYMFAGNMYPNYLSGTTYILSGGLINDLYQTALNTPYFHLEDIFLTGICAKKLGIKPINHAGFSMYQSAKDPCLSIDFVTRHQATTAGVTKLWNLVHNSSLVNNCKERSKLTSSVKPKEKKKKKTKPPACIWR